MRRRVNLKPLIVLLAAVVILGAGSYVLHDYQVKRNARVLLQQADRAEESGQPERAAAYLARYLSFAQSDAAAWSRYGLLLDRNARTANDRFKAFFTLERALRLDPAQHEVRRRTVRLALDLRRPSDAKKHLEILARHFQKDGEIEELTARAEEAGGQYAEAAKHYATAARIDPTQVQAAIRQARLMRQKLNDPEGADRVIDEMLKNAPDSVAGLLAHARYRREFGGSVGDEIDKVLKLAPDSPDVRLAAAEEALSQGRIDVARDHLKHGLSKDPKNMQLHQALARLELQAGRPVAAGDAARAAAKQVGEQPRLIGDAANLLLDVGDLSGTRELLARREAEALPPPLRDFLRGRLAMGEEKWIEARALLEKARPELGPIPDILKQAHLFLATCYRNLGNPEQASASTRAALEVDGTWLSARLELANLEAESGRLDEAIAQFEKLIPMVPSARWSAVRATIRRNVQFPPDRRNWVAAEKWLEQTPEKMRLESDFALLKAEVAFASGKPDEARKLLEAARVDRPGRLEYRLALASLAVRRKEYDRAAALIDEAANDLGDNPDVRLARARLLLERPGTPSSEDLEKLAEGIGDWTRGNRARLLAGLTTLYSSVHPSAARAIGAKLLDLQATRVDVRFALVRMALADGDESSVKSLLADLKRVEGEGPLWVCADAAARMRFAKADDPPWMPVVRVRLTEVSRQRPNWGIPHLLLGELEERQGDMDAAIAQYRSALDLGERSPLIVRRTVHLLQTQRRYDEVKEVLRKLQEQTPLAGELNRLAVEAAVGREPPERVLMRAMKAIPSTSTDARDHLWLGQVLSALKNHPTEAEEAFRKAVELNPKNPDTWVGLVGFLASEKQTARAEEAIVQAKQQLPPGEAAVPLAACWESLGKRDRADAVLREALRASPGDPMLMRALAGLHLRSGEAAKAEPVLRKLIDGSGESAFWARRNLAVLLALSGQFPKVREAQKLIDRNLAGATTPEDVRARALILARQPERRRDAIKALEESFRGLPVSPDERFLLARLHDANRDWSKAREILLALVAESKTPNPNHVAYYIDRLLARNESEEASVWVGKLEQVEPKAWRTTTFKARLLVQLRRTEDAVKVLEESVRASEKLEAEMFAGLLLEDLGQRREAEPFLRRYAERGKVPDAALPLARLLGRTGRPDEALGLCEKAGPNAVSDGIAAVCAGLLRVPSMPPDYQDRLEAWLKSALERRPNDATLLKGMADLHEQRGRASDAEAVYRRLIEPPDPLALNNLAVVLAHQGKGAEALQLADRAIAMIGPVAALLDTRAMARLAAGQSEAAVADLEDAIVQEPLAVRFFHLAQAHKAAGNAMEADDAYRRAREMKISDGQLHPLERATWRKWQAEVSTDK